MALDANETKALVARAIKAGLIIPADPVVIQTTKPKRRRRRETEPRRPYRKRMRGVRVTRECPKCHRSVECVEDVSMRSEGLPPFTRMIRHREREDRRGHANGAWCSYAEV